MLDYLIGGSLASSLHGIPRSTQDSDVVVDLPPGLRVQGARLDRGYLERGARELGLEGLLAEALVEARIDPPR